MKNKKSTDIEHVHNLVIQSIDNKRKIEYNQREGIIMIQIMREISERIELFKSRMKKTKSDYSFAQRWSLNKGIKKFGKDAYDAAFKEIKQQHDRVVFRPKSIKELNSRERRRAMNTLMFIEQKRNLEDEEIKLKGRSCANGSTQRAYMNKEDTSSPTATQEGLLITCAIDAKENREVATVDIPNAFVQAPTAREPGEDRIIMKIKGDMVDMLLELDTALYTQYVVYENGIKVIYVEVLRAIYGMLHSALLFYKMFRADLEKEGFKFNPYDPCVANKMIKGKQLTIVFHVDDVKVSSVRKTSVDDFI